MTRDELIKANVLADSIFRVERLIKDIENFYQCEDFRETKALFDSILWDIDRGKAVVYMEEVLLMIEKDLRDLLAEYDKKFDEL